MKIRKKLIFATLCLALMAFFTIGLQANTITYEVHVNTTSIAGNTGFLDFSFGHGLGTFDPASVRIYGFTTDGTFNPTPVFPDEGDVTGGPLPNEVDMDNGPSVNDHTQAFTFSSFFDVFVELDIPFVSGTADSPTSLGLNVLDGDGNPVLPRTDPDDPDDIDIGVTVLGTFNLTIYSPSDITAEVVTPEPGTMLLLASGLTGLIARRRARA